MNKLSLFDLSEQGLVFACGSDAKSFLQGQLTNDLHLLAPNQTQLQGYCTAKGRLLGIFRLALWDDAILLLLPRALQDGILERLRRYVLRADVTFTPKDDFHTLGIAGLDPEVTVLQELYGALPEPPVGCVRTGERLLMALPGPRPRYQVVGPAEVLGRDRERLSEYYEPEDARGWAWLDIAAGLPHIEPATQESFVPQMANLDLLDGVSFKKGCYPGQEIVARMHYRGKLKQRMIRVHGEGTDEPTPGDKVYAPGWGEQSAGTVVSAADNPAGGYDLLAVVQRSAIARGEFRLARVDGALLTVRDLPYAIDP